MNFDDIIELLFDECEDRFVTKTIYKRLDDFNRNSFTPAVRQFMQRSFVVPEELQNELEEKSFKDLERYFHQYWPWSQAFHQWHQELHSVNVLWKNVSNKSNVTLFKFHKDVKFIVCLLHFIRRPDLCTELLNILYFM